jgi:hypothetical protein
LKFSVEETEQQSHHDMIIGRDLQLALKLDILFSTKQFRWDDLSIRMRTPNSYLSYLETRIKYIDNPQDVFTTVSTPMSILDAKFEKANIDASINTLKHLIRMRQKQMKSLLYEFENLFDGTLGNWNTSPVSFKLKEGVKPFQLAPFQSLRYTKPHLKSKYNTCVTWEF